MSLASVVSESATILFLCFLKARNIFMPHLYDLLWSVGGEFLKMIHITDQEVEDVWCHQSNVLIGILSEETHTQARGFVLKLKGTTEKCKICI